MSEAWVRLTGEQQQLAAAVGRQLGTSGFGVVFLLLGGALVDTEGRLDADGREMLDRLKAMLDVDVTDKQQPPPCGKDRKELT